MNKRVALVTGGSSGIGSETAIQLAAAGFTTYAAARRIDRMEALKERGVKVISLDVTDEESIQRCLSTIRSESGEIDILVNNAGYGSYGSVEDMPLSEGRHQFDVNFFGLLRMTQLVLPNMRKNHYGKIVNVSSMGGKIYEPLGGWYHSSKFAVEGMSDSLRLEVQDFGIDVIIIEPGNIKTEWGEIAAESVLDVSGKTAYKDLAQKEANLLRSAQKTASPPDVIAKVILKSILAKRPKTRYVAGSGARVVLFMRKILSDRAFDKLMMFVIDRS